MGLDFKVPAHNAIEHWQVVEILFKHGIRFHSCGCNGPGYRPTTFAELDEFLAKRHKSVGELLLEKWQRK